MSVSKVDSVSVLMGAVTETNSLTVTVSEILSLPKNCFIKEILIAYPDDRVSPECRAVLESISAGSPKNGVKVRAIAQITPRMGFFSDLIDIAEGSHCVFFSSDGAMPTSLIADMVALEKENPSCIVSSSRWLNKNAFEGYDRFKLLLNRSAQYYLKVLYHTDLTDLTNAVQIAPTETMRQIRWKETGFARGMEMVLKPLRIGIPIMEIPTRYRERTEGTSSNSFGELFSYLRASLVIRLMKKEKMLNGEAGRSARQFGEIT